MWRGECAESLVKIHVKTQQTDRLRTHTHTHTLERKGKKRGAGEIMGHPTLVRINYL